jgi:hypothetical protein
MSEKLWPLMYFADHARSVYRNISLEMISLIRHIQFREQNFGMSIEEWKSSLIVKYIPLHPLVLWSNLPQSLQGATTNIMNIPMEILSIQQTILEALNVSSQKV